MPLPVIDGVLRITAAGAIQGGGRWSNTWHARNISLAGWTAASVLAFHDIFKQFYIGPAIGAGNSQRSNWPAGTTIDSIDYTPLDGTSGAFSHALSLLGTGTGSAMPAEVSHVLTIRTADRGRQNRGRIFLPATVTSTYGADGHVGSTLINLTVAQIVGVEAALVTGGAELGVGSYGPYKSLGTPHFTPVTAFTMDDRADVQRSRKR